MGTSSGPEHGCRGVALRGKSPDPENQPLEKYFPGCRPVIFGPNLPPRGVVWRVSGRVYDGFSNTP